MSYKEYNVNPKTNKAGDCVIRAISLALNQSWEQTYKDLCELGLKKCRMPNDPKVYESYLKDRGWVKCSEPRNWDNTKMKVYQALPFINEHILIIYAGSRHLTCAIDGVVYDTWNSSKQTMHTYWRKEK